MTKRWAARMLWLGLVVVVCSLGWQGFLSDAQQDFEWTVRKEANLKRELARKTEQSKQVDAYREQLQALSQGSVLGDLSEQSLRFRSSQAVYSLLSVFVESLPMAIKFQLLASKDFDFYRRHSSELEFDGDIDGLNLLLNSLYEWTHYQGAMVQVSSLQVQRLSPQGRLHVQVTLDFYAYLDEE